MPAGHGRPVVWKDQEKSHSNEQGLDPFPAWLAWSKTSVHMPVGLLLQMDTVSQPAPEVVTA